MALTNPPGFLQNAGATHTAAQLRTYLAGLVAGQAISATTLRARGGVHPTLGLQLAVTQTGSPSMAVLVDTGVANIPGSISSTQGNYYVANTAQETLSIAAAHATLPRIDIVVINVRDSQYSGVSNDSQLQVITGTPASSPVAPTAPDNSITLAQIAVAAAVTSIVDGNITDTRFYLAGVGGVIQSKSTDSFTGLLSAGQPLFETDTFRLKVATDTGATFKTVFTGTNVQVFTANGTWTKPAGAQRVFVQVQAGGGAGGGAVTNISGSSAMGGGGGGGGYVEAWFDASSLTSTEAVVVGAGGTGVSGAAGNNGGNSTFDILTANGGSGGPTRSTSAVAFGIEGGAGGGGSGSLAVHTGGSGGNAWGDGPLGICGNGGDSHFGGGGKGARTQTQPAVANGAVGAIYGGGGGGSITAGTGAAQAGSAGAAGVVIVTTYGV